METLEQALAIPEEKRDSSWEDRFFVNFCKSEVKVLSPEPTVGPDGWPYLMVETGPEGKEPVGKILNWLSMRGIGLVVNPTKNYPDFVFTYGMIWHFCKTGYFYLNKVQDAVNGQVELGKSGKIYTGQPASDYLPPHVRNILREFFRDQGILNSKILMISEDQKHFDLAFSIESLGSPSPKEHAGIAEALSWFLPPHYSVMLTQEKELSGFASL